MIKHALAIAVGCLSVNAALAQGGARLTIVPTGPGGCFFPKISDDGRVVAGTVTSFDRWLCFRWSEAEGLIELPCQIPRGYCVVTGLSSDGRVAMGTCVEFETTTGVRWVGANEPERILPGWYPKYSEALATNADGTVVVGVWRNWPAVWREGVGVTSYEERQGEVAACTDDGTTLYGCSLQGVMFRVRGDEPPTWLESLPGCSNWNAFSLMHTTTDGRVLISASRGGGPAWRWSEESGVEELRDGELAILYPLGVSGDGSVVVGLLDLEGYDDGLVWSRAWGIQRIEDVLGQYGIEFSHPIHVSDVSDDGLTFVGAASVEALDPVWIAELPRLCRVDLDDDERLTIFDFLAFQRAFGSELEEADFAEPYGVLDAMDYLAFQSLFSAGC